MYKNRTFAIVLRIIVTYTLLAVLLVSRIGIPVYSHICHDLSESWTSLYLPANACCSWTFQQNGHGCCIATTCDSETNISAIPCCENRTDLLRLNSAFILLSQTFSKDQHEHADAVACVIPGFVDNTTSPVLLTSGKSHGPPQKHHGRSLLIDHQVFRC